VELLSDVSKVVLPRFSQCQQFHCKYHKKEDRYDIKFFPKEMVVIIKCLECRPHMEIMRFRVAPGEN
jgi:hypothetical protein